VRAADGTQSYSGAFEAQFLGADDGDWCLDSRQLMNLRFQARPRLTIWAHWEAHLATPIAATAGGPATPAEAP
jgi:hypothetical protein